MKPISNIIDLNRICKLLKSHLDWLADWWRVYGEMSAANKIDKMMR